MGFVPRIWTSGAAMKRDGSFVSSRGSIFRVVAVIVAFSAFTYTLWLLISLLLGAFGSLFSHQNVPVVPGPGEDTITHFAGSHDCRITQSDIYLAPYPHSSSSAVSPFCKDRATLLEALSSGGRYGFDEPYVGKGCTYRWFSTPEVCMILERFNAVVFVGDHVAQTIYAAFNTLLREDLALGGLQQWHMDDQDRARCKCDNQFLDNECLAYAVQSVEEVKKNEVGDQKESPYYCERVPHAYLPITTTPAIPSSVALFKDLTYLKPNPWQPSPLIFSFSHVSAFDTTVATQALDEWIGLAAAAERNMPMLFLGAPAFSLTRPPAPQAKIGNPVLWQFRERMAGIAKQKHLDVLSLYNLTLQASTADGDHFGERVALVEAMMVINWLSKQETS